MFEREIVRHCSATLAGLKTGSTFMVPCPDRDELKDSVRRANAVLKEKGLRVIIAKHFEKNALIYLYRPERLKRDLTDPGACSILKGRGYPLGNAALCVKELLSRLKDNMEYPHEIGLFIGYPPEDVRCFMKDPREGVRCRGCWKAYGNEECAAALFERMRRCRKRYETAYAAGRTLGDLAVSVRA